MTNYLKLPTGTRAQDTDGRTWTRTSFLCDDSGQWMSDAGLYALFGNDGVAQSQYPPHIKTTLVHVLPVSAYAAVHPLFALAAAEAERARGLFPTPDWLTTAFAEEAGEVVKAVLNHLNVQRAVDPQNVAASSPANRAAVRSACAEIKKEIVQAMAMLIRLHDEGDPVHWLPSLTDVNAAAAQAISDRYDMLEREAASLDREGRRNRQAGPT